MANNQDNVDEGPDLEGDGRRRVQRQRSCRFCANTSIAIDFKDPQSLRTFMSERGKVVPRRTSGNCAKHQRAVTLSISRARNIALLPFTQTH